MSYTNDEIIKRFLDNCTLTFDEERRIIEWAKNCVNIGMNDCPSDCPIKKYRTKRNEPLSCLLFFAKYISNYGMRILVTNDSEDKTKISELANNCIKICNEIKIKTKRETPMQVVVSHSNGKTIYHCYNCGKPLFIQPSTQYCECCGQKLSFEVVENEI